MVANILKLFLWYPSLLVGRILFGIAAGITNFCYGKSLNETIPSSCSQDYGLLTNLGINMGIMVIGIIGLILPSADSSEAEKEENKTWRVVYGGYNLVMNVLGLLYILVFMQNPSVNDLILKDKKEEAFKEISKIYEIDQNLNEKEK